MKKVLLSSWGENGGVDDAVKNLQEGLEKKNIETDLIFRHRNYDNRNDPDITQIEDGKRTAYKTFKDFVRSRNWKNYSVADFHACNIADYELETFAHSARNVPVIYHAHGILPHIAYTNFIETDSPESRKYLDNLGALSPEEQARNIRTDFRSWPACLDQEALFRRASKVVFLTNFTKEKFRSFYPDCSAGDHREVIIPNGSYIAKYSDVSSASVRQTLGADSKIIMFSGRITPAKGASDLAKAFDRIHQQYPEAKLLLVGEPHSDFNELQFVYDFVRPEFRKDIIATGWISNKQDLASFYKAADALAIPSYHETFSIAALEAMALGTPVILGDVDGSHEVYVEPQYAYGTQPGDIDQMCSLFNYLFENPAAARENAANVQKIVKDKFDMDRIVDMTVDLYEKAISENSKE